MQPRGRREAAGIGRIQHREPVIQQALGVIQGQVLQIALGADADPLAEHALEVRGAEADRGGNFLKARLILAAFLDIAQSRRHEVELELSGIGCEVHHGPPWLPI